MNVMYAVSLLKDNQAFKDILNRNIWKIFINVNIVQKNAKERSITEDTCTQSMKQQQLIVISVITTLLEKII